MGKSSQHEWRYWLALMSIAAMFTGLFFSRALLSIAVIIFAANGIINPEIKIFFHRWRKDIMAMMQLLLVLIPAVSFFWSDDKTEWQTRTLVKLPLLFLPFGFYAVKTINENHFKWLSNFFIALMLGGSVWSLSVYLQQPALFNEMYLRAKVLPTPFDTNHIYFSFTTVVAILLCIKLFENTGQLHWKIIYAAAVLWFVTYLHILSAKTGLLCLYLSLIILGIYYLIKSRQRILAGGLLVICFAGPFIACRYSTTFKNRVGYVLYDYENYSRGNFIEGLSDGSRYRSLLAGRDIFVNYPLAGVGFGDIMKETNHWYDEFHPQIKPYERMLPSSELLMYACGAGITGMILFLLAVLLPLGQIALYQQISLWVLQLILIIFLLYEVSLEGQFGVFIYGFFTWWWMLAANKNKK